MRGSAWHSSRLLSTDVTPLCFSLPDYAVMRGKYHNIRMHTMEHNNQPDDGIGGIDLDIAPPPSPWRAYGGDAAGGWLLPTVGTYANQTCREGRGAHGQGPPACTGYKQPNQDWIFNSINQFSAACWHFAEHLTDIAESKNETIIPYGLIGSHWCVSSRADAIVYAPPPPPLLNCCVRPPVMMRQIA
jgi:hypothetical protein